MGTPATRRCTSVPMPIRGVGKGEVTSASCRTARHNGRVTARRAPWVLAGVLAGLAGLATSYATAMVLTIREAPVVAVAEVVIRLTPGRGRRAGHLGARPLRQAVPRRRRPPPAPRAASRWRALLARGGWYRPLFVWFPLAGVGLAAVLSQRGAGAVDALPVAVGLLTWVTLHSALTDALDRGRRRPELESRERRVFLMVAGAVSVAAVGIAVAGRLVGAGRRHVEVSRRLLRIPGVTRPPGAREHLASACPASRPGRRPTRTST